MRVQKLNQKPEIQTIVKRLDQLAERWPDLAGPVAFYRAALALLYEAQANVEPLTLPPEVARRKLAMGVPVLVGEDLPFDAEAGRELFLRLCRIVESDHSTPHPERPHWFLGRPTPAKSGERVEQRAAMKRLREAVERNDLDFTNVWAAVAAGDEYTLEKFAADHHFDFEVFRFLASDCLKPSLRVWARGFEQLNLDEWQRGQCPVCGSPPLFSEIQGKEAERRLRCGACGADWYYPRLQCAFCANHDYRCLGYVMVNGEEQKYHLQTCDQCRSYLKIVTTFDPTPVELLMVEDLATLHLDLIASQADYVRGVISTQVNTHRPPSGE